MEQVKHLWRRHWLWKKIVREEQEKKQAGEYYNSFADLLVLPWIVLCLIEPGKKNQIGFELQYVTCRVE